MRTLLAVLLPFLPIVACANAGSNAGASGSKQSSPLEGASLVIDVRSPEEWAGGHLEGATLIPVGELEARMDEVERALADDKTKKIVTYCRSGRRSEIAKRMIEQYGFSNVVNGGGYEQLR